MAYRALFALALYTLASAPGASCDADNHNHRPTVTIDSGPVAGVTTCLPSSTAVVNKFLGVRYAAPPVRFEPATVPEPWTDIYDASRFGDTCFQQFKQPEAARERSMRLFNNPPPPRGEAEDCLFINVFAPQANNSTTSSGLPVMLWFYGGGFVFGSGALPLYDGTSFAANQEVIVVTFNYRTNVFGFPGSPDLPKSAHNLGLLDQRLALDWVSRNIQAFGGDPSRVTIFGESAGAVSVDMLVVAPPQPVPFSAAIMESGQATVFFPNNASAVSWGKIVKALNCSANQELECVRDVPGADLRKLVEDLELGFFPVQDDGATWSDNPRGDRLASTDKSSKIARVPVLVGTNANEGTTFVYGQNDTTKYLTDSGVPLLYAQFIEANYPLGTAGISNDNEQLSAIATELIFQCPAREVTKDSNKVGIPAWRYYYNATFGNTEAFEGAGVWHSSEIGLVFGTYDRQRATRFQATLSRTLQTAWANFAKNPSQGPGWKPVPDMALIGGGVRARHRTPSPLAVTITTPAFVDRRCGVFGVF